MRLCAVKFSFFFLFSQCFPYYISKGIVLVKLLNGIISLEMLPNLFQNSNFFTDIDEMALPPCHCFVQFYVDINNKELSCQLYQRSADMVSRPMLLCVLYSIHHGCVGMIFLKLYISSFFIPY